MDNGNCKKMVPIRGQENAKIPTVLAGDTASKEQD